MAEEYPTNAPRSGAEDGAQVYREKGGIPWWAWLLLALLILALLWAFFGHRRTPQAAQVTPAPIAAPAPIPGAPAAAPSSSEAGATPIATKNIKIHEGTDIATAKPAQSSIPGVLLSDVAVFAATPDPAALIGERAKLINVPVQQVLSDRTFFVGPSAGQRMLVLLDKGMDAGSAAGNKVTIAAGQPVSLTGIVTKMPTQEAIRQEYKISGGNYAVIEAQKAYLHATVVQQK